VPSEESYEEWETWTGVYDPKESRKRSSSTSDYDDSGYIEYNE
jgi:hypothetical protein